MALEGKAGTIVEPVHQQDRREPGQRFPAEQQQKGEQKRRLHQRDDMRQTLQLGVGAARSEDQAVLARVETIRHPVGQIVPAVQQQAERKRAVDQPQPERGRLEHITLADGQQIEPDRCRPKTGPRRLEDKEQFRAKRGSWKRLKRQNGLVFLPCKIDPDAGNSSRNNNFLISPRNSRINRLLDSVQLQLDTRP